MVVEVDRPNRQTRRLAGKSDPVDAVAAGRAALPGGNCVTSAVATAFVCGPCATGGSLTGADAGGNTSSRRATWSVTMRSIEVSSFWRCLEESSLAQQSGRICCYQMDRELCLSTRAGVWMQLREASHA